MKIVYKQVRDLSEEETQQKLDRAFDILFREMKNGNPEFVNKNIVDQHSMNTKQERDRYMSISVQYYLAARWSTFNTLLPIAGNLFHHAIEMLLKKVIKKKLKHNLPAIWNQFKQMYPTINLAKFDKTIEKLHNWEEIRYPDNDDKEINEDMELNRGRVIYFDKPSSIHKKFHLSLDEIDELYKAIWLGIGIHPLYLDGELVSGTKKEIYEKENNHIIYKGFQISDHLKK